MKKLNVLVIGAGISGVTAALEIAEVGHSVFLIEKNAYLGGRVIRMNRYFPKLCPPYCGMEINFQRLRKNKNIRVLTSTTITEIKGKKGDFKVRAEQEAQYVNSNCSACGKCREVCPVEIKNDFNYGMNTHKAIALPHELAYPYRYHINPEHCLGESCAKCVDVCDYQAITLDAKAQKHEFNVHSIIIATGWKNYDPTAIRDMGYQSSPDIISNVEMERLAAPNGPTKGQIIRLSDQKPPKKVAFVQCAGSRDQNYLPYCSGVCCSASIKQALDLREKIPGCEVSIFYIDLRLSGRNESVLQKAEADPKIRLIKSKVARIKVDDDKMMHLSYDDIIAQKKLSDTFDLVVLATGIVPENSLPLKNARDENNFLQEDKMPEGIYAVGNALKPMDVSASLKDATGKALKALQL